MLIKRVLQLPSLLKAPLRVHFKKEESVVIDPEIKKAHPLISQEAVLSSFQADSISCGPLRVGVVFSGGPASSGHNVVAALFDTLKQLHKESVLIGFLEGPKGIVEGNYKEITEKELEPFRNQGGFDLLATGRDKIEGEERLQKAYAVAQNLHLDGIVIIGGDDSNTNAAILADYFLRKNSAIKVVGVPKTIDGDLSSKYVPISFGFDTATKIYSEMIGNLARDALSSKKYYHFIKLMGRSASHVTLECALSTQPNLVFISEERKSLKEVVDEIVDLVNKRAALNKNWAVILIPEGLIEFMPEISSLLKELSIKKIEELSLGAKQIWDTLPEKIQKQLLLGKDPHGNVNVSAIDTEELLINMVQDRVGASFFPVAHFFGYEGRCAVPSNFDANYCYALGSVAALLIARGYTSYMCSIRNLEKLQDKWQIGAIPIASLMHFEERKGIKKAVIAKTVVNLKGKPYSLYKTLKEEWKTKDCYLFPAPRQFLGEGSEKGPHILRMG